MIKTQLFYSVKVNVRRMRGEPHRLVENIYKRHKLEADAVVSYCLQGQHPMQVQLMTQLLHFQFISADVPGKAVESDSIFPWGAWTSKIHEVSLSFFIA